MKTQYTVVFSAWRASNDLITNMEASHKARQFLTDCGLPHWDAVGAYRELGQRSHSQEVSHVVHCDEDNIPDLKSYAHHVHNQDAILVIKSDDNSASLELSNDSIDLGHLVKVSKSTAQHNQAYTYFLGDYYICE